MGVVYEAHDQQGRRIALKTLRSTDPEHLYRLKREFRSLARITHPNLVQFHDLWADDSGWYLSMEFVDGEDFTSYCWGESGPTGELDYGRVRGACAGLVTGVLALHEHGVLHRDLKPSNVLVTASGRVVIVDFGLACNSRSLDMASALESEVAGTAAYMAPEQVEATGAFGPEVDWYAVGVMLFEVLSGRRPFEGPAYAVLHRKLREGAPRVLDVAPRAPPDLAVLCDRLLERDPARRAGARDVSQLLDVTAANPVSAPRRVQPQAQPRLEGRERELEQLLFEWRATLAGESRVVLVRGESGMGKTTLVRELASLARHETRDALVLSGRCYPREAIPFRAIDEVIDQLGAFWKTQPPADSAFLMPREPELLLRAFPTLARVGELERRAACRPRAARRDASYRSLAACREVFQRLSRRWPVMIILDDVQWLDDDSARLLQFLISTAEPPALLLVLCARPPSTPEPAEDARGRVAALGSLIELGPLPEPAMCALIGRVLERGGSDEVVALAREAAGNPFFGVRLAQGARAASGGERLDFVSVLGSQLAGLAPAARAALEVLAISETPLAAPVIARALGAELDGVYRSLAELECASFIGCAEPLQQGHFELYHDRIRQAVLRSLAPGQRQRLHRLLALEYASSGARYPEQCARHFAGAGDTREAALHARLAAELASAQLSFERAAEYYRMCLTLGAPSPDAERELHEKLADVLSQAGLGLAAAEEYLASRAGPDVLGNLHCEQRAAEELLRAGYLERGFDLLSSALATAGLEYPGGRRGLPRAGWVAALQRWRLLPRRAPLSGTELLVRVDLCATVANCLAFVKPAYSRHYQNLHVRLAEQTDDTSRRCRALGAEAVYGALGGEVTRATADAMHVAQQLASSATDDRTLGTLAHYQGMIAYYQGDWQRAFERSVAAERRLERSASRTQWEIDNARLYISGALHIQGRLLSLSRRRERWLAQAEAQRNMFALTIVVAGPARLVRLMRDEPDALRADLARVMPLWPATELSIPRFWELEALTDVDLYERRGAAAFARYHALADGLQKPIGLSVQVTRVKLRHAFGRAALAAALEQPAGASQLLDVASAQALLLEQEGAAWARALATLLRAGIEAASGRSAACAARVAFAARQLSDAGMMLDAWVARYWLGQLGTGGVGREHHARAAAWFQRQDVRNVPAFVAMRAPGAIRD